MINKSDGSVYIEAEGEEEYLDKLVLWCHRGSPPSRVDHIEVVHDELIGYEQFEIK